MEVREEYQKDTDELSKAIPLQPLQSSICRAPPGRSLICLRFSFPNGVIQQVKGAFPALRVLCLVCLCAFDIHYLLSISKVLLHQQVEPLARVHWYATLS